MFIEVLTGRLVGAGQGFVVVGLLLALAPGHDGGDLQHRVDRIRAWFADKRTRPRWRFAGGIALVALAAVSSTMPGHGRATTPCSARLGSLLYVGIVVCLRAAGLLVTDHSITQLHKRQLVGVFAALVARRSCSPDRSRSAWLPVHTDEPSANPTNQGCNGYIELCAQPLEPGRLAGQSQLDVVERPTTSSAPSTPSPSPSNSTPAPASS